VIDESLLLQAGLLLLQDDLLHLVEHLHFEALVDLIQRQEIGRLGGFAPQVLEGVELVQVGEHALKVFLSVQGLLAHFEHQIEALLGHHSVIALQSHHRITRVEHVKDARPPRISCSSDALSAK